MDKTYREVQLFHHLPLHVLHYFFICTPYHRTIFSSRVLFDVIFIISRL